MSCFVLCVNFLLVHASCTLKLSYLYLLETKALLRIMRTQRPALIYPFFYTIIHCTVIRKCPVLSCFEKNSSIRCTFSFTSRARLSFSFPSLSALIKRTVTLNRWSQINSLSSFLFFPHQTIILLSSLPWQMKAALLALLHIFHVFCTNSRSHLLLFLLVCKKKSRAHKCMLFRNFGGETKPGQKSL